MSTYIGSDPPESHYGYGHIQRLPHDDEQEVLGIEPLTYLHATHVFLPLVYSPSPQLIISSRYLLLG